MNVGIDIVEISRFDKLIDDKNFLENNFTKNEIEYCNKKPKPNQHFAVRFAAKEATIKALREPDLKFSDIEISKENNGAPYLKIYEKDIHQEKLELSLSHSKNNAIAFVINLDE